jgi:predicted transcriptional regulator
MTAYNYEGSKNTNNDKINNVNDSSIAGTSKDDIIIKDKLPLPNHKSPRRTKYMMQVERIRIRQMLLDGYTEDMIAEKLNLGNRQVQNYIKTIRQIDYENICQVDDEIKAHMICMTRDELNRLKSQMLAIVFSPNAQDRDKIAASEKARQYMLDIVNLTINGPLAFSIKRGDENGKQPVVSKYIRETTDDRGDNTVFS